MFSHRGLLKIDETPPVVTIKELDCKAFLMKTDGVRVRLLYPVYQDDNDSWYYIVRKESWSDDTRHEAQIRWFWIWDLVGKEKEDYEW